MTLPFCLYTDSISNGPMPSLSILTDAQLEDLYNDASLTSDADLSDAVLMEILKNRPDFSPESYDLQWELEDHGWNGGATQDDRDAR